MKSKGQITLFIIIGIILLVFAGIFMYIQSLRERVAPIEEVIEVPLEVRPVYIFIDTCFKDAIPPAIYTMGLQGGRLFDTTFALSTFYGDINYGYNEGNNVLPPLASMKADINRFANDAITDCANKLDFPEFEITLSNASSGTEITNDQVIVRVDFPITVRQDDAVHQIEKFITKVPMRIGHVYSIANAIVDKQISNPDFFDMSFLGGFDVRIDLLPHNENTIVYSIIDNRTNLAQPFAFLFAGQFIVNQPPVLDRSGLSRENGDYYLTMTDGVVFTYKFDANDPEGDLLDFSDDTAMFDILTDGRILFIPEITGRYDVTIRITDEKGNFDEEVVQFRISE